MLKIKHQSNTLKNQLIQLANNKKTSHLISLNKLVKGSFLVQENKPVNGIYFILQGKVKVFNTEQNNKIKIFRLVVKDDLVGYSSLNSTYYWSSAIALSDVEAYFINVESLTYILKNNKELSFLFINALSLKLHQYEIRQRYLDLFPAPIRVIEVLLLIAHKFGIITEEGIELKDCVSRKEIASMANTSTEKAIRTISLLKSKEYISLDAKVIIIKNKEALIELLKKYCCESKIKVNDPTCYLNIFY